MSIYISEMRLDSYFMIFVLFSANPAQPVQYCNLQDIQRTYDALGIVYPVNAAAFPGSNSMRLQNPEAPPIVHNVMGSSPMAYCPFARGQGGLNSLHNEVFGIDNTNVINTNILDVCNIIDNARLNSSAPSKYFYFLLFFFSLHSVPLQWI